MLFMSIVMLFMCMMMMILVIDMSLQKLNVKQLHIDYLSLLSAEEAEKLPGDLRWLAVNWWLMDCDSYYGHKAAFVDYHGHVNTGFDGCDFKAEIGVRPVFKVSNLGSFDVSAGDNLLINGIKYVAVSDDMILTKDVVDVRSYNTDYSADVSFYGSDIERFLGNWAKKQGFRCYTFADLKEACNDYFDNVSSFDDKQVFLAGRIVRCYEDSGKSIVYEKLIDFISSNDDFDICLVEDELNAAIACLERYKNIGLPKRDRFFDREGLSESVLFVADVQRDFGD